MGKLGAWGCRQAEGDKAAAEAAAQTFRRQEAQWHSAAKSRDEQIRFLRRQAAQHGLPEWEGAFVPAPPVRACLNSKGGSVDAALCDSATYKLSCVLFEGLMRSTGA